ncbi:MAG: LPS export ABC transporter permease LptF [Acidobacteriaceae bacterium]
MRIFTRYILREVFSHALLGGALFTFVLFMRDLGKILELVVRNSASFTDVALIFLYTIPNALTFTIPMAVLVGILLGLSRLAADSEITAMRACGFGVTGFVRIVSILAIAAWGLGLFNSLYLAPKSTAALLNLENSLKSSQASFEVQPRVFYEDFRNFVLYVQNVRSGVGASKWDHVFLADLTQPSSPRITTAEHAIVVNGGEQTLRMRLLDGEQHQTDPKDPNQYSISTFSQTDLPIQIGSQDDTHIGRSDTPIRSMSLSELLQHARQRGGKMYLIELNQRFSYPIACLVLMLVGVPLGLSSKRGGKSAGFVLTILLVFIYYFFSSTGVALARQDKVPVFVGVWTANIVFAVAGIFFLRQLSRGSVAFPFFAPIGTAYNRMTQRFRQTDTDQSEGAALPARPTTRRKRHIRHSRFPLILDDYVLREFLTNFLLVLSSFVTLSLIFSFFELLGDIIRNRTPLVTVGAYLINLIPFMLYNLTPLCVLIAVLVTFGVFNRSSELTAMKATGISLYRVVAPVLAIAALIAVSLFVFEQVYLPSANRRQEALRSIIKGKPAQTFLRPDQKWIFGSQEPGEPGRIFYYQFFDPDRNVFANLSVFEFKPDSFQLSRRIYASSAHWDTQLHRWIFEDGWSRSFQGDTISSYAPFVVQTFPEIHERPQYFKIESRQSQEMSYGELNRYIHELRQSGFDTMRLRVQLNHKLAYPLIALVMAILAVPFALSMGRRGSLTGIAVAIGVAIAYWVVAALFEAMGNVNTLPAALAAWSPDLLFGLAGAYLLLRTPT